MRKQIIVAAALGMLAMMVFALPASAGRAWCSRDPIVRINGTDVQIWVSIPEEYVPAVNGPVQVSVTSPNGTTSELIYTDEGFNGYGEAVRLSTAGNITVARDGSFDIIVTAYVPFDAKALRKVNSRANEIPTQVSYTTNGTLKIKQDGSMTVVGGQTTVIEQTNSQTRMFYQVLGR
jgi:hypothetical protein